MVPVFILDDRGDIPGGRYGAGTFLATWAPSLDVGGGAAWIRCRAGERWILPMPLLQWECDHDAKVMQVDPKCKDLAKPS